MDKKYYLALDQHKTDVMFRVDESKDIRGTVFGIMPHEVATPSGLVSTYQHVGQHSGGNHEHMIQTSRPATKSEYEELKEEMRSLGYNVKIVVRRNYNNYYESNKKVRQ